MIAATTGHVAASESGVEQGNSDRDRYILIEGAEDISRYEITVDGELAPDTDAGPDAPARISGCSAEGVLADETRRYRFSGEIRDFRIDGNAELYLDDGSESLTAVE